MNSSKDKRQCAVKVGSRYALRRQSTVHEESTMLNSTSASTWSDDCDLPLNAWKCSHISIGGPPPFPLTLSDGTEISAVDSTKDLGVTVTSTFKTSLQCGQAANRARRIRFLLRHGFAVWTPEVFRPRYLTLVRSILEDDQQASSPYLRRDIALMERRQRLATRMVKGMRELPYEDRLRRLNIFSLERRRLSGGLILAYNIFPVALTCHGRNFWGAIGARPSRT